MKRISFLLFASVIIICGSFSPIQAELWDSGNRCIYSTDLDISYLDVNSGKMEWGPANVWIRALTWTNPVTGQEFVNWRLPITRGTTIRAYDVTGSEMGHLYYIDLGLVDHDGLINMGPFQTLTMENPYWYGDDENASYVTYAPYFDFELGFQGELRKSAPFYVLPVHDGDVCSAAASFEACSDNDRDGFSPDGGDCGGVDCDDTRPDIYPSALEVCGNSLDENCDGYAEPCLIHDVAVTSLRVPKKVQDCSLDLKQIQAELANPGELTEVLTVKLMANDVQVDQTIVTLDPGMIALVSFALDPTALSGVTADICVEAVIEDIDSNPDDNRACRPITVVNCQ